MSWLFSAIVTGVILWHPELLQDIMVWFPTGFTSRWLASWAGYTDSWVGYQRLWVWVLSFYTVWALSISIFSYLHPGLSLTSEKLINLEKTQNSNLHCVKIHFIFIVVLWGWLDLFIVISSWWSPRTVQLHRGIWDWTNRPASWPLWQKQAQFRVPCLFHGSKDKKY